MGNKGFEAALAAVEMVSLKAAISSSAISRQQKQVPPSRFASRRNDKSKDASAKTEAARRSADSHPDSLPLQ